jgi:hypothetical protein
MLHINLKFLNQLIFTLEIQNLKIKENKNRNKKDACVVGRILDPGPTYPTLTKPMFPLAQTCGPPG